MASTRVFCAMVRPGEYAVQPLFCVLCVSLSLVCDGWYDCRSLCVMTYRLCHRRSGKTHTIFGPPGVLDESATVRTASASLHRSPSLHLYMCISPKHAACLWSPFYSFSVVSALCCAYDSCCASARSTTRPVAWRCASAPICFSPPARGSLPGPAARAAAAAQTVAAAERAALTRRRRTCG